MSGNPSERTPLVDEEKGRRDSDIDPAVPDAPAGSVAHCLQMFKTPQCGKRLTIAAGAMALFCIIGFLVMGVNCLMLGGNSEACEALRRAAAPGPE